MSEHEKDLLKKRQTQADLHTTFSHHLALPLMLLDTLALAAIATMLRRMPVLDRIVTVCAWSKTRKAEGNESVLNPISGSNSESLSATGCSRKFSTN